MYMHISLTIVLISPHEPSSFILALLPSRIVTLLGCVYVCLFVCVSIYSIIILSCFLPHSLELHPPPLLTFMS